MRTKEQVEGEISALQRELQMLEYQKNFSDRLETCDLVGAKHKWRLRSFSKQIDHQPLYHWGQTAPVIYEPGRSRVKAEMVCACGATVTYER